MSQTVREIAQDAYNHRRHITQQECWDLAAHVLASTEPLAEFVSKGQLQILLDACKLGAPDYVFGYSGLETLPEEAARVIADLRAQLQAAQEKLNTPEIHDFAQGVVSEAQHQRARWGSDHDAGKLPEDWFWLLGYLAGKCLAAYKAGDDEKAMHHMISTAAAIANWHSAILGQTNMRPGLAEEKTNEIG